MGLTGSGGGTCADGGEWLVQIWINGAIVQPHDMSHVSNGRSQRRLAQLYVRDGCSVPLSLIFRYADGTEIGGLVLPGADTTLGKATLDSLGLRDDVGDTSVTTGVYADPDFVIQ